MAGNRHYGEEPLPLPRLVLLALSLVVLNTAFLSQMEVFNVRPEPFLLLAVLGGLELGAEHGAAAGFIAGITADVFSNGRLGIWSLVCGLLGFGVGFARDRAFPAARERLPLLIVVGASWIGVISYVGIGYIVDEASIPSPRRIAIVLGVVAFWNVLLSWPMRFVVHRVVGEGRG